VQPLPYDNLSNHRFNLYYKQMFRSFYCINSYIVNIRMLIHSLFLQIFNQKWFTWKLEAVAADVEHYQNLKAQKSLKLNLLFDRLKRANVNLKKINNFFNIQWGLIPQKHIFQIDLIILPTVVYVLIFLKKESASYLSVKSRHNFFWGFS